MSTPINLKAEYGDVYRITLDESAEIDGQSKEDRLWLYQIPCRLGHIHPHGGDMLGGCLAVRSERSCTIHLNKLLAIPGVKVHQRGDTEASVIFHRDLLPQAAQVLGARKRKVYSEATLEKRREQMSRINASRP